MVNIERHSIIQSWRAEKVVIYTQNHALQNIQMVMRLDVDP
jgi:hypothetical protein